MTELIFVALLAALGWFWLNSMTSRETAVAAARRGCAADQVQLLDDTVALASLRLARNDHGQLVLRRGYRFEYSDTGDNRREGMVTLLGSRVETVRLGNVWSV